MISYDTLENRCEWVSGVVGCQISKDSPLCIIWNETYRQYLDRDDNFVCLEVRTSSNLILLRFICFLIFFSESWFFPICKAEKKKHVIQCFYKGWNLPSSSISLTFCVREAPDFNGVDKPKLAFGKLRPPLSTLSDICFALSIIVVRMFVKGFFLHSS